MRKLRGQPPKKRAKITKTIYARASGLTKEGEYRRAVSLLQSHGVADPVGSTLGQLRGQHPERRTEITAPKEWLADERARYQTDEKESSPEPPATLSVAHPPPFVPQPPADEPDAGELIETSVPITITGDVFASTRPAKKGNAGGLDQLAPWLWRRACESSAGNRLAKIIARIANRALRGHYCEKGGSLRRVD